MGDIVESYPDEPTVGDTKGNGLTLFCPIRGKLKVLGTTKDGLKPSEEARRIEAIRYLLSLGIPKEHIVTEPIVRRIGHGGRNSLRADIAVTNVPKEQVLSLAVDDRVQHALVLAEIKRDSADATVVRHTQVEPLLAFGPPGCLALYWDEDDQRVIWHDEGKVTHEGDLSLLPRWGESFTGAARLTLSQLRRPKNLKAMFERIADVLHVHGVEERRRFEIVLQLLLAKMWDERQHEGDPDGPLDIQDPVSLDIDPAAVVANFNRLLADAARHYNQLLPEPLDDQIDISPQSLVDALHRLAPWRVSGHSGMAIQDLYMWFAKKLYRRELAEYFTPPRLTEFIVQLIAPQRGELVKDPAVGSADFLMATARLNPGPVDGVPQLYGADISETGVMAARVNAILHDAAAITKIERQDALGEIDGDFSIVTARDGSVKGRYHVVVTNPPFGQRISVRDPLTLTKFDMGYEWQKTEAGLERTDKLLKSQESGVLFVEASVRQVLNDGGRIAIIVPNGYLGNRSVKYHTLREWILRHTRVAGIVSCPRFTFKGSGADVSASVLLLERRLVPLEQSSHADQYHIAVEMLERLGWNVGVKNEQSTYRRDQSDGSLIFDANGNPIPDDDYGAVLERVASSPAAQHFPWLAHGIVAQGSGEPGWSIDIATVLADPTRALDPKRLCAKYLRIKSRIEELPHFRLGDVIEVLPELTAREVAALSARRLYRYVEIQDVGTGVLAWNELRGWQLPTRARHLAQAGDLFVGGIWGSVSKWFIAPPTEGLLVTNGFHRLRVTEESKLVDIVAGLCSEAYAVQMRALSRGSDGLAEVTRDDLQNVVLPEVTNLAAQMTLQPYIDQLLEGHTSVRAAVSDLIVAGNLSLPPVEERSSHVILV